MTEADLARTLGFLRPEKYGHYERERRWLCARLPELTPLRSFDITDTYLDGTRMRLRRMTGRGVSNELKLTKKGELSADTRIITTIYLDEAEFAALATLSGRVLCKTRHYFAGEFEIAVDVFARPHDGLIMAEVEFPTDEALRAYTPPDWFAREVTHESAFSGGALV